MHAIQVLAPGHQLSLAELGFDSLSGSKALCPLVHPALELESRLPYLHPPSSSHHLFFYLPPLFEAGPRSHVSFDCIHLGAQHSVRCSI